MQAYIEAHANSPIISNHSTINRPTCDVCVIWKIKQCHLILDCALKFLSLFYECSRAIYIAARRTMYS